MLHENDLAGAKWLWSKNRIAWLQSLDLHPWAMLRLEMSIEELKSLKTKIDRVEKELARYADKHPAIGLLMTIPGVGIRTAETFVTWVDDIGRYRRTSQLGCYFGLVPGQDASADKNRLGHITRDGPPVMRKLITEATWTAIKRCPAFKRFFDRVMASKADRKKVALIATAHRLIRVMGAMLRTGQAYDANHNNEERSPLRGGRSGENPIGPQAVLPAPARHLSPASPPSLATGCSGASRRC